MWNRQFVRFEYGSLIPNRFLCVKNVCLSDNYYFYINSTLLPYFLMQVNSTIARMHIIQDSLFCYPTLLQYEKLFQLEWIRLDSFKTQNWMISNRSHYEIKSLRILSFHSFNPSIFLSSFHFPSIHPVRHNGSLLPQKSRESKHTPKLPIFFIQLRNYHSIM